MLPVLSCEDSLMHKYSFIVFILAIFLSSNTLAAEFEYRGKKIKSSIKSDCISCGGYQIHIESEKFPLKYEQHVPEKFRIDNFYGSNSLISRKAYFIKNKEKFEIEHVIIGNRKYLPTKARCKGNDFVVMYWSGGNCKESELFVEFRVEEDGLSKPRFVSYEFVCDKYN